MSDTAATRASTDEREAEISVLIGRLGGELCLLVDQKVYDGVVCPLLVSAAALADQPYAEDSLMVRQARADRALARLREAAKAVEA